MADDAIELTIFMFLFLVIAVMGFAAARWQPGETMRPPRRVGPGRAQVRHLDPWFLIGGDLYTAYTFVAVPALLFGAAARSASSPCPTPSCSTR